MIIILIGIFIFILFYLLVSSPVETSSSDVFGLNILFFFIFIAFFFLFLFIKSKNPEIVQNFPTVFAKINDIFSNKPEINVSIENKNVVYPKKQVFNIPEQNFNYQDAQTICKAFDSQLATVEQVNDAYKDGADWCNMGWSDNQLGLYPTQQSTYDKLQTIPGHEHDCGIPGVNGGYISNSETKLGVNCFGIKPEIDDVEKNIMENVPFYPKTVDEEKMEEKIDYWKKNLDKIILSPFNHYSWSKL
uniref:Link domain-containing protein n=1 Tax=viral metagenome TaxID=1070528 RepID=A0A6C0H650_9ZZZZ